MSFIDYRFAQKRCKRCKIHSKKCDKVIPKCSRCKRAGFECVYESDMVVKFSNLMFNNTNTSPSFNYYNSSQLKFSKDNFINYNTVNNITNIIDNGTKESIQLQLVTFGVDKLDRSKFKFQLKTITLKDTTYYFGLISYIQNKLNLASIYQIKHSTEAQKDRIQTLSNIIFDQYFWQELVYLYFKHWHKLIHVLSPSIFTNYTNSEFLTIMVQWAGYQFKLDQPVNITKYINTLGYSKLKQNCFKPSLNNLNGLIIGFHIMLSFGNRKECIALSSHITRMAFMLGVHINTNYFSNWMDYDRKLAWMAVIQLNTVFQLIAKLPNFLSISDIILPITKLDYRWQLVNSKCFKNDYIGESSIVYAKLTNLSILVLHYSCAIIIYPALNNKDDQFSLLYPKLSSNYQCLLNRVNRIFELLFSEYPNHYKLIKDHYDDELIKLKVCRLLINKLHFEFHNKKFLKSKIKDIREILSIEDFLLIQNIQPGIIGLPSNYTNSYFKQRHINRSNIHSYNI
ncbi:hypothetical protein CONCODRAFT_9232 [Conidiobolus coronatus NRRL 28638]|uniref:Zn(2)-C6 fungal-type domain-containing protein n=1 Tax=Conidiobolus coronatus (strain ATCC 28846 / CBS 209.66 / NRRL 28638) TaxID=796925 RepID=A0A137P0B4_CONC2|nr:hypothetical protein CONCODRAFT_9232 [Conidiobolus coronatus NRRL 28638]|eukprot:KXN68513.1 hypothetical protein CONCODRAFT_9232 [Conidiobolus coronatus NRRL 28638]